MIRNSFACVLCWKTCDPALSRNAKGRWCGSLIALTLCLLSQAARGLEPEQVLLLVNREGVHSRFVADAYAKLRGIPEPNIVELSTESLQTLREGHMRQKDFIAQIWEPVQATIKARKLESSILAWIYSTDFPVAVNTVPPISLTGFTYVRGQAPSREQINTGSFASPLFAGPLQPGSQAIQGLPFDHLLNIPAEKRPVPSMMLGVNGARGNTTDEILRSLHRSAQADGSRPEGTVFFVDSKDVRVKMRRWQWAEAMEELKGLGQPARIITGNPTKEDRVAGLMMGTALVHATPGCLPGSYADHLTSFAAHFNSPGQTKCTHWLSQGASVTTGTVSEPYSYWTKFPNARLFAHRRRGLTAIEALYASVACPLQLLAIGDPFSRPYGPKSSVGIPRQANKEPTRPSAKEPGRWQPVKLEATTERGGGIRQTKTLSWATPELVDVGLFDLDRAPGGLQVRFQGSSRKRFSDQSFAGIVFNYQGMESFSYFGLHGYSGAWVLAQYDGKVFHIDAFRAEPISINASYALTVVRHGAAIIGRVDGREVFRSTRLKWTGGAYGLLAGRADSIRYGQPKALLTEGN
jgi:uncharacterized protein (TIGR03790 family)